jgi:hypothetical protein
MINLGLKHEALRRPKEVEESETAQIPGKTWRKGRRSSVRACGNNEIRIRTDQRKLGDKTPKPDSETVGKDANPPWRMSPISLLRTSALNLQSLENCDAAYLFL